MITVSCFTNLDEYQRESWPSRLPCKPAVGESVKSESGKSLKIVAITYHYDDYIQVELHR